MNTLINCAEQAPQRNAIATILTAGLIATPPTSPHAFAEVTEPGSSLGFASIANFRDIGGYDTGGSFRITHGLLYRSNQLSPVSPEDMEKLTRLDLATSFDLRTEHERSRHPDDLPTGVRNIWLNVLKDDNRAELTGILELLQNPEDAHRVLGDGHVELIMVEIYRDLVSLPSARAAYQELFVSLANENNLPALVHCTSGKDRTGWAIAALLALLDVPEEAIMEDYLRSNDYINPDYREHINAFAQNGGDKSIPMALFGVKSEYLEAPFEEMRKEYGSIEQYFADGLGIDAELKNSLRDLYRIPNQTKKVN